MEARLERAVRSSKIDGEIGREIGGGVEGYDDTDVWARKTQVATLLQTRAEGRDDGRLWHVGDLEREMEAIDGQCDARVAGER